MLTALSALGVLKECKFLNKKTRHVVYKMIIACMCNMRKIKMIERSTEENYRISDISFRILKVQFF